MCCSYIKESEEKQLMKELLNRLHWFSLLREKNILSEQTFVYLRECFSWHVLLKKWSSKNNWALFFMGGGGGGGGFV